ncbi:hypothetical protein [Halomarina pelagica]|uniref:hypothetical protein n=1 Tax=Halomarina pelagica TaxID=2961599 RepID=UPI0020C23147|nr:hypothetical protein [Halomarina sp. BND7]
MPSTPASRRAVFRPITTTSYHDWPAYDTIALYDRRSLGALKGDIRTVATVWFEHDVYDSLADFVCHLPLAYVEFQSHDRYPGVTQYEMPPSFACSC